MGNLILFALFIILLVAVQFTSAKTADDIIEKYIRAVGGRDKLITVKSVYMEGIKEVMGIEVVVKVLKQPDRPDRTEIESDVQHDLVLTGNQPRIFFSDRFGTGLDSNNDSGELQTELDIAGTLVDYIAKGHKATLMGKETVEENTCHKIKLITRHGDEMMLWVDTGSYLLKQSSAAITNDVTGIGGEIFTIYKDHKQVDGIQFAYTLQTKITQNNSPAISSEILFYKIVINKSIDAKMLQSPYQS